MKRNKQLRHLLLGSFLLLSGLLAAFVLDHYQKSAEPEHADSPPKTTSDLSMNQFHYTETRDGEPVWELRAESAEHDLASGLTQVKDIKVVFFNRTGLGDLTLSAAEGDWLQQEKRLSVSKDVVLSSPEGYTCYADQLVYTESDAHLRSSGPVRLVSSQVEIRGVGLDINMISKKLQLLADVRSSWNLKQLLGEAG
jgi:lipopolysaccharide export system protein LptC